MIWTPGLRKLQQYLPAEDFEKEILLILDDSKRAGHWRGRQSYLNVFLKSKLISTGSFLFANL